MRILVGVLQTFDDRKNRLRTARHSAYSPALKEWVDRFDGLISSHPAGWRLSWEDNFLCQKSLRHAPVESRISDRHRKILHDQPLLAPDRIGTQGASTRPSSIVAARSNGLRGCTSVCRAARRCNR